MSLNRKSLDTQGGFVYKTWLFGCAVLVAATAFVGGGAAHAAEYVLGVPVPKKSVPEGQNRFVVPGTLRDAVKFFKKKFRKKRPEPVFIDAVDHPNAKVVHIRSGDTQSAWEGINIAWYGRKVHVFVIPRGARPRPAGPSAGEP